MMRMGDTSEVQSLHCTILHTAHCTLHCTSDEVKYRQTVRLAPPIRLGTGRGVHGEQGSHDLIWSGT